MKKKQYECPKCKSSEEVNTFLKQEIEMIIDDNEELYEFVTFNCKCHNCGYKWEEYARLTYDGYYDPDSHNVYNAEGSIESSGVFM